MPEDLGEFGCVLAANLVCRLPNPYQFLDRLPSLVAPGGTLIITSPYSWSEQFTPKVRGNKIVIFVFITIIIITIILVCVIFDYGVKMWTIIVLRVLHKIFLEAFAGMLQQSRNGLFVTMKFFK